MLTQATATTVLKRGFMETKDDNVVPTDAQKELVLDWYEKSGLSVDQLPKHDTLLGFPVIMTDKMETMGDIKFGYCPVCNDKGWVSSPTSYGIVVCSCQQPRGSK